MSPDKPKLWMKYICGLIILAFAKRTDFVGCGKDGLVHARDVIVVVEGEDEDRVPSKIVGSEGQNPSEKRHFESTWDQNLRQLLCSMLPATKLQLQKTYIPIMTCCHRAIWIRPTSTKWLAGQRSAFRMFRKSRKNPMNLKENFMVDALNVDTTVLDSGEATMCFRVFPSRNYCQVITDMLTELAWLDQSLEHEQLATV